MKFSNRVALMATTLGLVAATAVPVFANAQTTATTNQTNPRTSMIQSLVARFHLNQTDVESFFQEQDQARIQQMAADAQTRLETRLTADVTSGKLTAAQKSAILAKATEARAKHEAARKLTPEECKKVMDAYRTELETWATAQGIDKSYLRDIMGPGPGGHMGGPEGMNGQGRRGGPRGGMFGGPMRQQGAAPTAQTGSATTSQ